MEHKQEQKNYSSMFVFAPHLILDKFSMLRDLILFNEFENRSFTEGTSSTCNDCIELWNVLSIILPDIVPFRLLLS